MPEPRRNLVAWAALLLTLVAYAVATASTITSQGQRITSLEQWREREQNAREQMVAKLNSISDRLIQLQTEQRILHEKGGR